MKKIIILTLALILAFSLAACGDNGGDPSGGGLGDITVGGSSTPGQTESQTQQPSGNIEPKLIGVWGSGIDVLGTWYSYVSGAYESTAGTVGGIEFRADGTFESVWVIAGKKMTTQSNFKGNYKVDGNKIFLTNVMYKFTSVDDDGIRDSSHGYKPVANHNLFFEIAEIDDTHYITFDYDFDLVSDKVYFGDFNSFYPVVN